MGDENPVACMRFLITVTSSYHNYGRTNNHRAQGTRTRGLAASSSDASTRKRCNFAITIDCGGRSGPVREREVNRITKTTISILAESSGGTDVS